MLRAESRRHVHVNIQRGEQFPPGICDARTVGVETFSNSEFQIVLNLKDGSIVSAFNNVLAILMAGTVLKDKYHVRGVVDSRPIRIMEVPNGSRVLRRIIIPDPDGRWPEDPDCKYPYSLQNDINLSCTPWHMGYKIVQ